ncbi:MAG: adenosylcobinamide-phosphate synthase CbiB [Cyanobacteria bacterium P01_F01_bin.150]
MVSIDITYSLAILAIALLLDYLIGDPWNWIHPVQVIGKWIERLSKLLLNRFHQPLTLKIAGIFLGLSTIVGTGLVVWGIVYWARWIHPFFGLGVESILVASGLAGRSLRDAAYDVLGPLSTKNLDMARDKMALYVGRDTQQLGEAGILRAVMETVSENATDGVLAPFWFAMVGAFLPTGSATLVLGYKAASTLDSMVGYKTPPFKELGWFSAKFEDGLTWLPCRLVVATISVLSGKPRQVWHICRRDAPQDPSPNAGWSECAYAAALGVQLGGINYYQGQKKEKPLLGDRLQDISPDSIDKALSLTRWSLLLWMGLTIAIASVVPF